MSVIVKATEGGTFTPHPTGQYAARCIDVVDLGWQRTTFGPKYKIRLVFFCGQYTDEKEIDGEKKRFPMTVQAYFTASLHEKANLRAFCKSWRGQDFSDAELKKGFDFERMIGAPAFIQVGHNKKDDKVYANIESIMRLPKEMNAPLAPEDYVRVCDREDWTGPAPHPDMETSTSEPDPDEGPSLTEPDDDLPF